MSVLTVPVLASIDVYRRWVSPFKGFRCAHAALHGGASCSAAVRALVAERGVAGSRAAVVARFAACRAASAQLHAVTDGPRVRGVCCCGPVPIPFRCG